MNFSNCLNNISTKLDSLKLNEDSRIAKRIDKYIKWTNEFKTIHLDARN